MESVTRQSIYSVKLRHPRQSSSAILKSNQSHSKILFDKATAPQSTNGVLSFACLGKGVTSPKYTGVTMLWVTRIFGGLFRIRS